MSKILKAFVSSCIILTCLGNLMAAEKYSPELLNRQLEFYSPQKAQEFIEKEDYIKAAINAISIYPVLPKDSIHIALLIENKISEPLPQFLFKTYRQMGSGEDLSVKIGKDGKTSSVREWINQKAKWSNDFINEIKCYIEIRKRFKENKKSTDKFFWGAFRLYYSLNSEEASKFLKKFDKGSPEFKILSSFAEMSVAGKPVNIEDLNKIYKGNLSRAMKELLVILKGDYYIAQQDFGRAKEVYLEFFELDYSLPFHIESLATCHLLEGDKDEAKFLYLHLTKLIQKDNISANGIYNLACILANEGDKEGALYYLKRAIKSGFPKSEARDDKDLKSLREDKRFIELMK